MSAAAAEMPLRQQSCCRRGSTQDAADSRSCQGSRHHASCRSLKSTCMQGVPRPPACQGHSGSAKAGQHMRSAWVSGGSATTGCAGKTAAKRCSSSGAAVSSNHRAATSTPCSVVRSPGRMHSCCKQRVCAGAQHSGKRHRMCCTRGSVGRATALRSQQGRGNRDICTPLQTWQQPSSGGSSSHPI